MPNFSIGFKLLILCILTSSCIAQRKNENPNPAPNPTPAPGAMPKYFLGADFSYVNELESCGAIYKSEGREKEIYSLFKEKGASIARFRLWHNPEWTQFSTFADVKKGIKRAKEKGMRVLLDFHYSDTWTDPSRQNIPKAWKAIMNVDLLGDSLFAYTKNTLMSLHSEGLLPEIVQIGNEVNAEILQYSEPAKYPINWPRNSKLLKRGLEAVQEVSTLTGRKVATMLHIAQPENAFYWFNEAKTHQLTQFDWIGLSYYPQWSKMNLTEMGKEVARLKSAFGKRVMVVECGYPFSIKNIDQANNLLDTASQMPGYSINAAEQKRFVVDMTKKVIENGGEGLIYWEPAWISTPCKTQWGTGSHWDNATFFSQENQNALPVFDFFNEKLY
jgi:arabinogalactan endo-1,4-beta-galactosidase